MNFSNLANFFEQFSSSCTDAYYTDFRKCTPFILGNFFQVRISRACTSTVPDNLHPIVECKEGDLGSAVGMYKDCKSFWEAQEDLGANKDTTLLELSLGQVTIVT